MTDDQEKDPSRKFMENIQDVLPFTKKHREELRNFTDPQYLKEKSIWWWMEQILTAALLFYLFSLSGAVMEYKTYIDQELQAEGCYEFMNETPPPLINESKTSVPVPELGGTSKPWDHGKTGLQESNFSASEIYNRSR